MSLFSVAIKVPIRPFDPPMVPILCLWSDSDILPASTRSRLTPALTRESAW